VAVSSKGSSGWPSKRRMWKM